MGLPVKLKDSRNRRIRFAGRQPQGKRIALTPDDDLIFEAIYRHGHLPSHYLREFTSHENANALADRLTKLFHGAELNGPFLTKPEKQHASFFADIQHLVYDLHPNAIKLVEDKIQAKNDWLEQRRKDNHFVHALMNACVGASLELGLRKKYIPRYDVLLRQKSKLELPLAFNHALVPDDLFGINYGGSYRFFAVEIDRNTESIDREPSGNKTPPTIGKKFEAYLEVLRSRLYRDVWGVPNLMVLIVSTSEGRLAGMMRKLKELDPVLASRFLFKADPTFGPNWRVPEKVLTDLITPWARADGSTFDITKEKAPA